MTSLEYFQKQIHVDYYLNGSVRKIEESQKIQTFNANLSLSENYPLSLHEQVLPIVDLMALNNSHFKKLKEFITLQLPSGFPVKVEIPLYRVITAKVTFGNIHAIDQHVDYVATIKSNSPVKQSQVNLNVEGYESSSDRNSLLKDDECESNSPQKSSKAASKCIVDECVFKVPPQYRCTNLSASFGPQAGERHAAAASSTSNHYYNHLQPVDDDDILLQLAIQQSLSINATNEANEDSAGNATASMQLRDSRGATKSLQEFNQRVNNSLTYNQADEDLMLQR